MQLPMSTAMLPQWLSASFGVAVLLIVIVAAYRRVASKRPPSCVVVHCDDWVYMHAMHDLLASNDDGPVKREVSLPVTLLPHLLYGSKESARDVDRLRELGVTHIVNAAGRAGTHRDVGFAAAGISVLRLDAEDEEGYPILAPRHLDACRRHVAAARRAGGRCLVHCVAGINRSGALCAAEVMLHDGRPLLDAVAHCAAARGHAFLWNRSFRAQLVVLARERGCLGPRPQGVSNEPFALPKPRPNPAAAFGRLG
jgi:hypothetical protein